jgi:LDH2 family malate/lactate/ureidoglycolate dehydrogenase
MTVANHLVDAHLTGYTFAGLPRLLVVLDRIRRQVTSPPGPLKVTRETPLSAHIDGNGNLGYVVCDRAINLAIEKASSSSIAVVGASNSYYSGRSGYYTERAARAGFIAIHASSAFPMMAPTGATRPILGSNPITAAFPAGQDPVVVDLSTAAATWGELQLAQRVDKPLADGVAIDAAGQPTRDPVQALTGAVLPFGGHKGYALGLAVQALGIFAGGDAVPDAFGNFGFFFVVMQRDLLVPREQYDQRIVELVETLAAAPPAPGTAGVLIPGQRGAARRRAALAAGGFDIPEQVYEALLALA